MQNDHRLKVLEQQFQVMQKEVSEVLGEMQNAFTSVLRANEINIRAMYARIAELENLVDHYREHTEEPRDNEEGVEL